MDKRYIVFKCCMNGRKPIVCFDASGVEEANDNLAWLKKKHAGDEDFELAVGEFFEILEKSQVQATEWDQAELKLCPQKGGRATPRGGVNNSHDC